MSFSSLNHVHSEGGSLGPLGFPQRLPKPISVASVGPSDSWSFLLLTVGGHSVQVSVWIPCAGWSHVSLPEVIKPYKEDIQKLL